MKHMPSNQNAPVSAGRLSFALAAVLGLAGLGATTWSPRAEALVCLNCATWMTQIPEYIAKIIHFGKEINAWKQQAQDMQAQISNLQNMAMQLGIDQSQNLTEIPNPKQFMVEERCGSEFGGGVSGIVGSLTGINLNGNIFQQQYRICSQRQYLQNERFNLSVRFMKQSLSDMKSDYAKLQAQNAQSKKPGDNDKADQDAAAVLAKYKMRQDNFEQDLAGIDGLIAGLGTQTETLGRAALRGKSGYMRQVTNAVSAYAALCGGGKCS